MASFMAHLHKSDGIKNQVCGVRISDPIQVYITDGQHTTHLTDVNGNISAIQFQPYLTWRFI